MEFKEESKVNPFLPPPPTLPAAKSTFDRAFKLISGERRDHYGTVEKSFKRIAQVWSGLLGVLVTPQQVALCMTGLKLCREANSHKEDSIDDAVGYLGLLAELESQTQNSKQV